MGNLAGKWALFVFKSDVGLQGAEALEQQPPF